MIKVSALRNPRSGVAAPNHARREDATRLKRALAPYPENPKNLKRPHEGRPGIPIPSHGDLVEDDEEPTWASSISPPFRNATFKTVGSPEPKGLGL